MGASPQTKAEYREEIARKQAHVESLKAQMAGTTNKFTRDQLRSQIGNIKGEIAHLKAKMANAPK